MRLELLCLAGFALLIGCEASPRLQMPVMPAALEPVKPIALPREINTGRSAAMQVATFPPVEDVRTRMEIMLHASLYKAAYESNVGDGTNCFLVVPVEFPELADLEVNEREFRMRVLAEMSDLPGRIAWATDQNRDLQGSEFFPGTRRIATRLQFKVLNRIESEATVSGEISDFTPHVGASRQRVIATWDGQKWNIERGKVQLIW